MLLACLLPGPLPAPAQDPGYSFSGGDGSTQDAAVIVHARTEALGIKAEYAWIRAHWPGATRGRQALGMKASHFYDSLTITDATGRERIVYFDISEYFGK